MMTKYGKLSIGLIAAWFVFSMTASAFGVFQTGPNDPPLPIGLAATLPLVLFALWFSASSGFRHFTLSLNPRVLTLVQSWRIVGYAFLILAAYGILPKLFAWPAGWGDIFVGATAPFVALKLVKNSRRRSFVLWQALGILDLVNAVTLGALAGYIDPKGVATGAMTVLPLSLIPTFLVPLFLILHVICIAQARQSRLANVPALGDPVRSVAV
ncbi:MAG TPA: hypothetical protein VJQ54_04550 [Candidatus Sulfotelmatobacter sp.]|nr:hypothetical protein [Candidatus Sulfotelmatobacter sp.]